MSDQYGQGLGQPPGWGDGSGSSNAPLDFTGSQQRYGVTPQNSDPWGQYPSAGPQPQGQVPPTSQPSAGYPGQSYGAPQGGASGWQQPDAGYGQAAPQYGQTYGQQGYGQQPWGQPAWQSPQQPKQGISPVVIAAIVGVLVVALAAVFLLTRGKDGGGGGGGGEDIPARALRDVTLPQKVDDWTLSDGDDRKLSGSDAVAYHQKGKFESILVRLAEGKYYKDSLENSQKIPNGICGKSKYGGMNYCYVQGTDGVYLRIFASGVEVNDIATFATGLQKGLS